MQSDNEHGDILQLLRQNQRLLEENNVLLKKMYRYDMLGLWARIFWYAILIGLPFALYFYVLEPYFEVFGANYETFRQGMAEIPGLKGLEHILPSLGL